MYRIDISTIVYFQADGNYTHFILAGKMKGSICMNLAKMQEVLDESLRDDAALFARIGKSYIVNLNYVYHLSLTNQRLTLSDGATFAYQLSVSREALRKLKQLYQISV